MQSQKKYKEKYFAERLHVKQPTTDVGEPTKTYLTVGYMENCQLMFDSGRKELLDQPDLFLQYL